jgi:predicted acylesterase/phospholipase RssA
MSTTDPQRSDARRDEEAPFKLGIVVSGGAPTIHLAAGALCAFSERGIDFEIIACAGAGALPALLFTAPKNRTREDALKRVVNINLHDAIYHLLPNNYKVFHKYGPFSQFFWQLGQTFHTDLETDERYNNSPQRLYNDLVDLIATAVTPTTLRYGAKSVLTRVEVINDLVDWDGLKRFEKKFYLNAFSLKDRTLRLFDQNEMTPQAFYAALAMPWLYPPTEVSGVAFTEGASHDPSGLEAVMMNGSPAADPMRGLDGVIIVDTIGPDFWVDPESTLEALALTIMDPMSALTENVVGLYAIQEHVFNETPPAPGPPKPPEQKMPKVYRLPFNVPFWEVGKLWDWSYSNALALWDAGHDSALTFCSELLPGNEPAPRFRQIRALPSNPRAAAFLELFGYKPHAGLGAPPAGAERLFE